MRKRIWLNEVEELLLTGERLDSVCSRLEVQGDSVTRAILRAGRRGEDVSAVEKLVRAERRQAMYDAIARRWQGKRRTGL
jgi:hypothetical protein